MLTPQTTKKQSNISLKNIFRQKRTLGDLRSVSMCEEQFHHNQTICYLCVSRKDISSLCLIRSYKRRSYWKLSLYIHNFSEKKNRYLVFLTLTGPNNVDMYCLQWLIPVLLLPKPVRDTSHCEIQSRLKSNFGPGPSLCSFTGCLN